MQKLSRRRFAVLLAAVAVLCAACGGGPAAAVPAAAETAVSANHCRPGQTLDADGLRITCLVWDGDWSGGDPDHPPGPGMKLFRARFAFENTGEAERLCGAAGFTCLADGVPCFMYPWAAGAWLSMGEMLPQGRALRGCVYFEVPADAFSVVLLYDLPFWEMKKAVFLPPSEQNGQKKAAPPDHGRAYGCC